MNALVRQCCTEWKYTARAAEEKVNQTGAFPCRINQVRLTGNFCHLGGDLNRVLKAAKLINQLL